MMRDRTRVRTLGLVLLGLVATGCVAPGEYRRTVSQYDAEIAALRAELEREKAAADGATAQVTAQMEELTDALDQANDENERLRAALESRPQAVAASAATDADLSDLDQYGIGVEQRAGEAVITIPSSITFASGSATLSAEGRKAIDAVGKSLLREYPQMTYSIEGHTDSDPISKSKFASNRDLSLARAMAVLRELVDGPAGVPDEQCAVVGWGPHRPVASNDTKADKARNRRVEIVVKR